MFLRALMEGHGVDRGVAESRPTFLLLFFLSINIFSSVFGGSGGSGGSGGQLVSAKIDCVV